MARNSYAPEAQRSYEARFYNEIYAKRSCVVLKRQGERVNI